MRGSLAGWALIAAMSVVPARAGADAGRSVVMAVPVTPTDRAAVGHLRLQLGDAKIELREVAEPRDLDALMQRTRDDEVDAYIVVLDGSAARVHVLRPSDGTKFSRTLDASAVGESPYVLALAAGELLELARGTPRADAGALPPTAPPEVAPWGIGFSIGLAAEASASPAHDGTVIRPRLDAELVIGKAEGRWRVLIGARVSPYGQWSRDLGMIDGVGTAVRVLHERYDVGGSVGVARRSGDAAIAGLVVAGASRADTRAKEAGEPEVGSASQTSGWVGAGLALRYGLGAGFAVALSLEVVWLPEPARYLVRGTPALVEGPVRLRSAFALRWGLSP